MKYKELLEQLQRLEPEQLDMDVTVYVSGEDEFYAAVHDYPFEFTDVTDVLDAHHPYIVI